MGDLLDIERQEAALTWSAMEQGLPIEFRSDLSPLALLGLKLITTPRADALPETSPGIFVADAAMKQIVRRFQSVSIRWTTRGSGPRRCWKPNLLKTFRMAAFSGRTSAISSLSPAARAMTARWRINSVPTPCP